MLDTPGHYWLDVDEPEMEALYQVLAPLNLHQLVLEDCLDDTRSSLISRYEKTLYLEFPTKSEDLQLRLPYISIVKVSRLIITIRRGRVPMLSDLADDLVVGDIRLFAPNSSSLMYTILDHLVDHNILLTLRARSQIDELVLTFDKEPESVELEDILEMRRQSSYLAIISEEQLYCVTTLLRIESQAFAIGTQREYFRDLVNNAEHALRFVNRQETRLKDLYDHYQLTLYHRTEGRLRILTILSAIFLPLTLISSIYGMNFEYIPELSRPYGYPLVLGLMVITAATMVWFFYRRGWFE